MSEQPTLRPLSAAIASALIIGLPGITTASANDGPQLSHTTVVSDLENPWDMAFLADGTMFFTERCRGLSVRLPDGDIEHLLGMEGGHSRLCHHRRRPFLPGASRDERGGG